MSATRFALVAAVLAAPVFAQSVVRYELQIGGDNHADEIKAGVRTLYTPGDARDGQWICSGVDILHWAATVTVSGNHHQPGHPSDGLPTQGLANMVFNLELHKDSPSGPLVLAEFYSSVHDGPGALDCLDCPGTVGVCAGAAFAFSFNLEGAGPARMFEGLSLGGPNLSFCGHPAIEPGWLEGMGAGYIFWCRGPECAPGTITTKGVGIPIEQGGLGIVAVVEGQITARSFSTGRYALVLKAGAGTNVLRGDVDLDSSPAPGQPQVGPFAVAANQVVGDTIEFDALIGCCPPPSVVSAFSRRTHGDAGTFDIALPGIEPRTGGPTTLVVNFAMPVQGAGGLDPTDVQLSSGTVTDLVIDGNQLIVQLTGVTNGSLLLVRFPGIVVWPGCPGYSLGFLCIRVLEGDARGDSNVNIFDLIAIRNELNKEVTGSNFTRDVNADGAINIFDLIATRNRTNTVVPACP